MVGSTIGSREEVPGERHPVTRNDDVDDKNNEVFQWSKVQARSPA
jgi:hypothetical protein